MISLILNAPSKMSCVITFASGIAWGWRAEELPQLNTPAQQHSTALRPHHVTLTTNHHHYTTASVLTA